jgi:hypothetical protein
VGEMECRLARGAGRLGRKTGQDREDEKLAGHGRSPLARRWLISAITAGSARRSSMT